MMLLAAAMATLPEPARTEVPLAPVLDGCTPSLDAERLVCTGRRDDGLRVVVRGRDREPVARATLDLPDPVGEPVLDGSGTLWMVVDRPQLRVVAWRPGEDLRERWLHGYQEVVLAGLDTPDQAVLYGSDRQFGRFVLPLAWETLEGADTLPVDCRVLDGDGTAILCGDPVPRRLDPATLEMEPTRLEISWEGAVATGGVLGPRWTAARFDDAAGHRWRAVARDGERLVEHTDTGEGRGLCAVGDRLVGGTAGDGGEGLVWIGPGGDVRRTALGEGRPTRFRCGAKGVLLDTDGLWLQATPDGRVEEGWGWRTGLRVLAVDAAGVTLAVGSKAALRRTVTGTPTVGPLAAVRGNVVTDPVLDGWSEGYGLADGGRVQADGAAVSRVTDGGVVWTHALPPRCDARVLAAGEHVLVDLRGRDEAGGPAWQSLWTLDVATGGLTASTRVLASPGPYARVLALPGGLVASLAKGTLSLVTVPGLEELGSRDVQDGGYPDRLVRLADGGFAVVWREDERMVVERWPRLVLPAETPQAP